MSKFGSSDTVDHALTSNAKVLLSLILCLTFLGTVGIIASSLNNPEPTEDNPTCLKIKRGPRAEGPGTYPWGKALKRGFVTRAEYQVLRENEWTHKARIKWHNGVTSWETVSIPIKAHRKLYINGTYPDKTIYVVLMSEMNKGFMNVGLVVPVKIGYDDIFFSEVAVDMAHAKCDRAFTTEWAE